MMSSDAKLYTKEQINYFPLTSSSMEIDALVEGGANLGMSSSKVIGPDTPLPDRRNEKPISANATPLTTTLFSYELAADSFSICATEVLTKDNGLCTPKSCIFDPFAPGADRLIFAPQKKPLQEMKIPIARRLVFEPAELEKNSVCDICEGDLLATISRSVLDVIVSMQVKEEFSENFLHSCSSSGCFSTPKSLPLLSSIADTCPPAPRKSGCSRKMVKMEVCKKLEFDN